MKYLRDLVADDGFVKRLSLAFSDLRADFELDLETSKEKVEELLALHVATKDHLDHLATISRNSSGVILGLRGTGKTHLMLLSRHRINSSIFEEKNFCVYVNLKRLDVPSGVSEDSFKRMLAAFICESLVSQLVIELKSKSPSGLVSRLRVMIGDKDKKRFLEGVARSISLVSNKAVEFLAGTTTIDVLGEHQKRITEQCNSGLEMIGSFDSSLSLNGLAMKTAGSVKGTDNTSTGSEASSSSLRYFDAGAFHRLMKDVSRHMGLGSLTFYIDEWEKIYGHDDKQRWTAEFINKVIDTPIFFWIAYVPYRGNLAPLSIGADLQHRIDLDSDLIIENSKGDRQACIDFFTDFINKRLNAAFHDSQITIKTLINNNQKLELIILGSMGNTRDFGTILLAAWQEFKTYRQGKLKQGKPYQYISDQHLRDAIKADGRKKIENIKNNAAALAVWNSVIDFLTSKRSSHFAILENQEQKACLQEPEFSELVYQRLVHFRKAGVEPKDLHIGSKLMIVAASYSATQDLHSKSRKITFFKDNASIDSRVRRYIFDLARVIKDFRVKEGRVHPCKSCGQPIDAEKMKAAWLANGCPFCGGAIH